MKNKIDHSDPNHVHIMTTRELISDILNKLKRKKVGVKLPAQSNEPPIQPQNIAINHIAVVLDGRVEEVIRAENRLAALFLSNPDFIEFDPEEIRPTIGWKYENDQFRSE